MYQGYKEENLKIIRDAKGVINVEGYGEDGTICPICLENKKSIICLPCKHFFCRVCMNKLLDKGNDLFCIALSLSIFQNRIVRINNEDILNDKNVVTAIKIINIIYE